MNYHLVIPISWTELTNTAIKYMNLKSYIYSKQNQKRNFQLRPDDDRRALTSDVTAYVNKNPYRVVQFPFKAWISKVDDVKRVIGVKPVWA